MFRPLIGRGRNALYLLHRFSTQEPNRLPRFVPHLEPLERRYALDCAAINQAGVLEIKPDPGGDTITLSHDLNNPITQVTQMTCQNNTERDFADSLITGHEIEFNPPSGGDDIINIERTVAAIQVKMDLGPGNDTINFSPAAKSLQNLQVTPGLPITVNGSNTGTATLTLFNENGPAAAIDSTAPFVKYNGNALVYYTTINMANVHAHPGPQDTLITGPADVPPPSGCICYYFDLGPWFNEVIVEGTRVFTPVTITSGGGTDTVNISPTAGTLDTIQGTVNIIGSREGNTTLSIFDENNPSDSTFRINEANITHSGAAQISYSDIQSLTLNAGTGNVTYSIESTPPGTAMTINESGFGDNAAVLSPTAHQLATIAGPVTINGNYGFDTLVLDDGAAGSSTTYVITDNAATVDSLPSFSLTHFLMNVVNVLTTPASTVCNEVIGSNPDVEKNGVIVAPGQCSGPGPSGGPTDAGSNRKAPGHCGCSPDAVVTRPANTNGAPVVSTTAVDPGLTARWRQARAPDETGAITIAAMPDDRPQSLGRVLWYKLANRKVLFTDGEEVLDWAFNQE